MTWDISRYQQCTVDDSSYMSPIRPRALGLTCSSSCTFSSRRSCQSCVLPVLTFHPFFLWWKCYHEVNHLWWHQHSLGETRLFSFTDVFSIQGESVGMEGGDSPLAAFSKAENLLRQVLFVTPKNQDWWILFWKVNMVHWIAIRIMSRQLSKYIDGVAIADRLVSKLSRSHFNIFRRFWLKYLGMKHYTSCFSYLSHRSKHGKRMVRSCINGPQTDIMVLPPAQALGKMGSDAVRCGCMTELTWHILVLLHFVVQFSNVRKAKSQVLRRCLFATLKLFAGGWASDSYTASAGRPFDAGLDRLSAKEAGQSGQVYDILSWWMWERQWLLSICLLVGLSFWLKFNYWTAIFGFVCV